MENDLQLGDVSRLTLGPRSLPWSRYLVIFHQESMRRICQYRDGIIRDFFPIMFTYQYCIDGAGDFLRLTLFGELSAHL